jgi:HPt (histidine-containing phosphotransfer) domain-containing protein
MIELDNLREISGGDEEFIIGVLTLFVSKENEYARCVDEAISAGDLEQLRQIVHKIKSSVSVIGMSKFRSHLNELEKKLLDQELSLAEAAEEANVVLDEFHKAEEEVRQLLLQMRPNG